MDTIAIVGSLLGSGICTAASMVAFSQSDSRWVVLIVLATVLLGIGCLWLTADLRRAES